MSCSDRSVGTSAPVTAMGASTTEPVGVAGADEQADEVFIRSHDHQPPRVAANGMRPSRLVPTMKERTTFEEGDGLTVEHARLPPVRPTGHK